MVMSAVFLILIPAATALVEMRLGWSRHWVREPWLFLLGAALFPLSLALSLTADWAMTRDGRGTPLPQACAKALVRTGPYRWVRNPMAIGGVGQGFAVGAMIGSPLVMLYALIGAIWWEIMVRPEEERCLVSVFGEEYDAYRSRVKCWLPTRRAAAN